MATAPDPAPVKQMETLLECSVCMETLTQPRTLSCYHSFCKHCLENYVAAQREKAVEAKAKVPEIFECPLCRTEFSVKEEENIGEKMPANHFINNLLELLSIQQQAHHVKCQSCKSNAPAASRCISCEKYLCQKCLQTHNKWPDFEDHIVLTLEELAKPENRAKVKGKSRCEKHDKILKFYCETCKVLVCRYCMELNHTRPEHTWFPLTDVVVQHKEALKAFSGIFEKQKNDAAESNRKIADAMATLKNNATKARDAIKQQQQNILNAFTKKLEKETTALLDQVEMKYRNANEPLLKQQANVKAYFEKAKSSLDITSNILSSGSDEVLLALKREIEEKAGSIVNERPEFMEPIHDGFLEYHPKRTKDIMKNLKLNDLGKIVNPVQQSLSEISTILEGNIEHAKQLVEWMKDTKFGWHLCYRASRDGWEGGDFHRNCDDVGPTLTLVKCGTNIFGGFTDQSWNHREIAPDEVQLYVRSTILDGNTEHAKQLVEWMEDTKFGLQLCYRASRDGWEADDFHRKCDDVGPTLTLVKCGTNIFGGFTDQSWKHTGHMEFKRSNSSFLFSLKNKENMRPFRCPIKDGENNRAICCHRNCGAAFGGYDLYISSNANRNKNSFSNLGHTYQPPPGYEPGAPRTNALLAGSYEFTPSEIEVFHS